jgi:hypothetical protein
MVKLLILNLFWMVGGHQANIGQVAVALGVVHSVPNNEEIGNGKAYVVCLNLLQAARRLVEQRGDAQGFGMLLKEKFAQVGEGEAGIENIFDQQNILALDRSIEVLDELDRAGGSLPFAIAGGSNKVEGGIGLNGSGEIGKKEGRALEHSDHHQLFTVHVSGNLSAHFGHTLGDLLAGIENLKALNGLGIHTHSIAECGLQCEAACANQGE